MTSRVLRTISRTVPPKVAKCCTEAYRDSYQPLSRLPGRYKSSQNGVAAPFRTLLTYPKLYSDPTPSPVGASASRALVSESHSTHTPSDSGAASGMNKLLPQ